MDNLIKTSSGIIKIGNIKIQGFYGPVSSLEKVFVKFPEPFEHNCLSVLVTTKNDATVFPAYDVSGYSKEGFYIRSSKSNASTWVTAIGY